MNFIQHTLFFATFLLTAAGAPGTTFTATIRIEPDEAIGKIQPGIYGQYLEHVEAHEETIYPSLWDDTHKHADRMGIRTDVARAVKNLGTSVVRWPGGCFADVYHWEDAIGPRKLRQPKPNLHWGGMESNMFGTDEFIHWCRLAGVEPYINVNLGSGTLAEALRWLEYVNGSPETPQGRRRADNATTEPYGVRYWGIGNETWGPWETGHADADTYGTSLSLWAKAMRKQDPSIRILGVGSEEGNDRHWDSTVLAKAGADIDLLTVHMYGVSTRYDGSEYEAVAFTPVYLENRLERTLETIDHSTASQSRKEPLNISIDEWNIRHSYDGKHNRKSERTMQDAVFTAGFLNAMIRKSPRVEMANYVFLVNGNATLLVNEDMIVWTTLAHLFKQYAEWMHGTAVTTIVDSPGTTPPPPVTGHPGREPAPDYKGGNAQWIDAVSARHNDGALAVAIVNRHPTSSAMVEIALKDGWGSSDMIWRLHGESPYAKNTFEQPDQVIPTVQATKDNGITCPPHSVTMVLFKNNRDT